MFRASLKSPACVGGTGHCEQLDGFVLETSEEATMNCGNEDMPTLKIWVYHGLIMSYNSIIVDYNGI